MIITGQDIDEVLYLTCKQLINSNIYSPRNLETKELIFPQLIINNIQKCIINNPARKLSKKYLNAELDWYLSGDKSINKIKNYASMWEKIADKNNNVNSNYGEIVFKQKLESYKKSQYDWVIQQLINDKETRQAIINFNQTKHKYINNKDFVCTIYTQYIIRNNKLISITNMRSNDIIYGLSYDFPFFSYIHQKIYNDIKYKYPKLQLGYNIHTAVSLHVYKRHFEMINNIVKEYENNKINSKSLQELNLFY